MLIRTLEEPVDECSKTTNDPWRWSPHGSLLAATLSGVSSGLIYELETPANYSTEMNSFRRHSWPINRGLVRRTINLWHEGSMSTKLSTGERRKLLATGIPAGRWPVTVLLNRRLLLAESNAGSLMIPRSSLGIFRLVFPSARPPRQNHLSESTLTYTLDASLCALQRRYWHQLVVL